MMEDSKEETRLRQRARGERKLWLQVSLEKDWDWTFLGCCRTPATSKIAAGRAHSRGFWGVVRSKKQKHRAM